MDDNKNPQTNDYDDEPSLTRQRSIFRLVGATSTRGTDSRIEVPPDCATYVATLDEDEVPITVRLFHQRLSDFEDMGRPTEITVTVEPGDALNDLAGARDRVRRAEGDVVDQVREARRNGKSWHDIGVVFGISRQAAWEAYARRIGDEATLR